MFIIYYRKPTSPIGVKLDKLECADWIMVKEQSRMLKENGSIIFEIECTHQDMM